MNLEEQPAPRFGVDQGLLRTEIDGAIAVLTIARPNKRNALSDELVELLGRWFSDPPATVRAAVLDGQGDHFCAGLDLAESRERSVAEGVSHSRSWHRAFEHIEFGTMPVVAVLHATAPSSAG